MTEAQLARGPAFHVKALGVSTLAALVVPFLVTGLFYLDASDLVVTGICLVVGVGLISRGGLPRSAGVGWLAGCVLYATFLLWLFSGLPDSSF